MKPKQKVVKTMPLDERTDPAILLSAVNMKLRDTGKTLEGVCEEWGLDPLRLLEILRKSGFDYDPESRRFLPR